MIGEKTGGGNERRIEGGNLWGRKGRRKEVKEGKGWLVYVLTLCVMNSRFYIA